MTNRRWIGSAVTGRWMPEIGTWRVTSRDHKGWCELKPLDDSARTLAQLTPSGIVYIRQKDLLRLPEQEETLL